MSRIRRWSGAAGAHPPAVDRAPTVIDLDRVLLTPAVVIAWDVTIQASLPRLQGLAPAAIPDEQGRVWPDGRLEIFVTLPDGRGELTLAVPPAHWAWRPGRA